MEVLRGPSQQNITQPKEETMASQQKNEAQIFIEQMKEDSARLNEQITKNDQIEPEIKPIEYNQNQFILNVQSIRRSFVRKVFLILFLLILKLALYSALCMYYAPIRFFYLSNIYYILFGAPVYIICVVIISMSSTIRKSYPWNYILLLSVSTSMTYMVGGICVLYGEDAVLMAFGVTTIIVLSLSIFACQTKWDLTGPEIYVFCVSLVLLHTVVLVVSFYDNALQIALAGLGVLIYSIFIVIDIQLIIGGNHKYEISPEEYIFAVTILYIDIINIFLRLLRLSR